MIDEHIAKLISEAVDLGGTSRLIDYYRQIQDEVKRLEMSKEVAKEAILQMFRETGLRYFRTDNNLVARADPRTTEHILVKEAKAMLPEDVLKKLLQETAFVVLSVRKVKAIGEVSGEDTSGIIY